MSDKLVAEKCGKCVRIKSWRPTSMHLLRNGGYLSPNGQSVKDLENLQNAVYRDRMLGNYAGWSGR